MGLDNPGSPFMYFAAKLRMNMTQQKLPVLITMLKRT
jgi:hypothetical protein